MKDNRYCVIMAGGSGNRLWPISRDDRPKQFIEFSPAGKSFLRLTYDRYAKILPKENILVVTLEKYESLTHEILPELPLENLLLEPFSRGTAPCMAFAAVTLLKRDPEALLIASPSDHLIRNEYLFDQTILQTLDYVKDHNVLMTLGVVPKRPDVTFGYIQVKEGKDAYKMDGPLKVKTFTEKPDEELAKVFIRTGEFFWNSGIFVWKAVDILAEMDRYIPEVTNQFVGWEENIGTETEKSFIERCYADCPKESLDYGVMERTDRAWLYPAKFGWTDIGSWESLYRFIPDKDDAGNAINTKTHLTDGCANSIFIAKNKEKLLAVKGLENYIIVDTDDVLLICPKDDKTFRDFITGIAMPDFEEYR